MIFFPNKLDKLLPQGGGNKELYTPLNEVEAQQMQFQWQALEESTEEPNRENKISEMKLSNLMQVEYFYDDDSDKENTKPAKGTGVFADTESDSEIEEEEIVRPRTIVVSTDPDSDIENPKPVEVTEDVSGTESDSDADKENTEPVDVVAETESETTSTSDDSSGGEDETSEDEAVTVENYEAAGSYSDCRVEIVSIDRQGYICFIFDDWGENMINLPPPQKKGERGGGGGKNWKEGIFAGGGGNK